MPNRLRAALSGVVLLALTGCSALPGYASAPAPSTTPVPTPTTSLQVRTVATPKPRSAAPVLKTTGVAWPAILASLAGYGQWLLAN